jgi:hypothetical protein
VPADCGACCDGPCGGPIAIGFRALLGSAAVRRVRVLPPAEQVEALLGTAGWGGVAGLMRFSGAAVSGWCSCVPSGAAAHGPGSAGSGC